MSINNPGVSLAQMNASIAAAIAAALPLSSGTYNGDGSQNRAIAHTLGVMPRIVIILASSAETTKNIAFIIGGYPTKLTMTGYSTQTVTAMTAANFYVGNAVDFVMNAAGSTYNWVALP